METRGNPTREYNKGLLYVSPLLPISVTSGQAGFLLKKSIGRFYEYIDGTWEFEWWITMNQTNATTSSYTIWGITPRIDFVGEILPVHCDNDSINTPSKAYMESNSLVKCFHNGTPTGQAITHGRIVLASRPYAYVGLSS